MGLRKINPGEETSYMFTDISVPQEILIILLRSNTAFSVKLNTDSDTVKKWCRNLQKSQQEYIDLLHKAVETCSVSYGEEDDNKNEDIFEIQEDCLVWKQFFPDQNVYGKRGKFTLVKMEYNEAVAVVLNGVVGDLDKRSTCILKLKDEIDQKSNEVQKAKDLTKKSVKEKEDFEKEVYGKCISLINAKKLRIKQLISSGNRPSTSVEETSCSNARRVQPTTQSSSKSSAPVKSSIAESDGYSSNTDVDDVNTDEENEKAAGAQKRKHSADNKPKKSANHMLDSQELFNDSLEAELYPTDIIKKPKVTKGGPSKSSRFDPETSYSIKESNGKNKNSPPKKNSLPDTLSSDQNSYLSDMF